MFLNIRKVLYHGIISEIRKVGVKAGRNRKTAGLPNILRRPLRKGQLFLLTLTLFWQHRKPVRIWNAHRQ